MGVQVCDERQIADSLSRLHIGNVTGPYLVGTSRNKVLDEIRILAVAMLGVSCLIASAPLRPHHEPVPAQHLRERVTAWETACVIKQLLQDGMQFGSS